MSEETQRAGQAALTLIESLIIHLKEAKVLSKEEVSAVFEVAIEAHRTASRERKAAEHDDIADLLQQVEAGNNGVRMDH